MDFKLEAETMREEVIALRRDFHRYPELGFEEERTAGIVVDYLKTVGLKVQTGVGKTGVVGLLEGAQDGPTVLYRADMDALPVQEANETEYASTIPGKMHACGHDAHVAMALVVAKLLAQHRDQMAGRVKFVFQPAEELGSGAKAMIADGVLENPCPDISLGMHVWNDMPFGKVGVTHGPSMAGAGVFDLTITGKGGHGAAPHLTADPVVCAAQIIAAFQTIVSRNLDPLDTAVVTVAMMKASDAFNIIPQTVELAGTMRSFTPEVRDMIDQRLEEISQSICTAMGCTAELTLQHHTIPVCNHPDVAERVRSAVGKVIDTERIVVDERTMGSEDMSFLMDDIPGTFVFLGSAKAPDQTYSHHHPRFDIDENCLPLGVGLMATAIADYVIPE